MATAAAPTSTQRIPAPWPFFASLGLIPVAIFAAIHGGWAIALLPMSTWYLFSGLDYFIGVSTDNADPETSDRLLFWHRFLTMIWVPLQIGVIFGVLWFVTTRDHLLPMQEWALFAGIGILSGTVGINYAHELMHQRPKIERWAADILLACVLYSHFRSEHLLVHHPYVGTSRDPVTARYNEGFYGFFVRVLRDCPQSAFKAEKAMLARKDLPWYHQSNPFWRYGCLQLVFLIAAGVIGGWWGVFLFATQAFWAVFQLELVNYVEHYGLTRKHLGDGKYDHVQPRHSWNAGQRASNWLLINLQRHSDHHFKPNRRFPLLQTYAQDTAPQLPYGYPVMTMVAVVPRFWRRVMNPRVRQWRRTYYPEIDDWHPYSKGLLPQPGRDRAAG